MNFEFSDEQRMLRDSARVFLEARTPPAMVRTAMETDVGFDPRLWADMAQLGWQAMAIPEEYGGAGFTMLELGVVIEELGRALTPTPFLSSVVLGANAVLLTGTEDQKRNVLPPVAAGKRRLALAVVEEGSDADPGEITTTVSPSASGSCTVNGAKSFVVDGHTATDLVVVGRNEHDEIELWLVPADAPGVTAKRIETLDMTRKQAVVSFDNVVMPDTGRMSGGPSGLSTLDRLYDLAAVALAFEQVGGAARCMEMSVRYAKDRYQFGRPIGSFQAIKHKCADMLVAVEGARSAAYYAGWAASRDDDDLPVAAALAKSYCSDAFFDVAAETIQVHGGIGFTWEHDAHLYFKRAKTDRLLFGDPAAWRARLAEMIDL